jgi:PII-like signaling protein
VRVHATGILRLPEDLTVVIEVVDREDRIRPGLPELDAIIAGDLIALERVKVGACRSAEGETHW